MSVALSIVDSCSPPLIFRSIMIFNNTSLLTNQNYKDSKIDVVWERAFIVVIGVREHSFVRISTEVTVMVFSVGESLMRLSELFSVTILNLAFGMS